MHLPLFHARSLRGLAAACLLAGLQACAQNPALMADDPQFGQALRSALRGQELTAPQGQAPEGVSFTELEHGLERYKAPAGSGAASRSGSGAAGAAGSGAGAARPMLQ